MVGLDRIRYSGCQSRRRGGRPAGLPVPRQQRFQRFGIEIVRKAVQMPLRQIAENAGEDGAVVTGKVLDREDYNWGFDAQAGEFKDLVTAGIIDPTKVVRIALQNAASVAGLLITTEAMVAEKPEKKTPMPQGAGMGGGMEDMGF
jgi:chaperonin GroEL